MKILLKEARAFRRLSKRSMAKKIDVTSRTYCQYEKAPENISVEDAKKIAQALDINYDSIFFGSNSSLTR